MKKLIISIIVIALISCESEISPNTNELTLPAEYDPPKMVSLPYQEGGVKLELIEYVNEGQFLGALYSIDKHKLFSGLGGKLYRTNNGGKDWELKFTSPVINSITSKVAFNKNNPTVGFATGGRAGRFSRPEKEGWIARTKDSGESWKLIYLNPEMAVLSIYPIPSNPGIVLALVGMGYQERAIIRSADNGDTWSTVYEGDKAGSIIPLTDQYLFTTKGLLSKDYGLTWSASSIESIRNLQGIHVMNGNGSVDLGIGYDIRSINNNSGTQVVQTNFDAKTLVVKESKLVFTSDQFQLHYLEMIHKNSIPILLEIYDQDEDGLMMVYPRGSRWQPLILNGEGFNPPYPQAVWWVDRVSCFDWGCYLFVGCYGSDLASYSRLIRLTYE